MAHTIRDKAKLVARVRRLKGQLEAVERALEAELPCAEVLRQLASARGAMNGLIGEVIEGHLHDHVLEAGTDEARRQGAEEVIDIIRSYMK
ncbi:MAG: metal/formaldehyde-sensitive transcriptional repressor [Tropicimonas sp.]|uniref:metal/formaldehyde-sensitive transcriptional repressor n=1 Tax=Tropicimonas sp. TaxID=2067044 RepID=UPI003A83DE9E